MRYTIIVYIRGIAHTIHTYGQGSALYVFDALAADLINGSISLYSGATILKQTEVIQGVRNDINLDK